MAVAGAKQRAERVVLKVCRYVSCVHPHTDGNEDDQSVPQGLVAGVHEKKKKRDNDEWDSDKVFFESSENLARSMIVDAGQACCTFLFPYRRMKITRGAMPQRGAPSMGLYVEEEGYGKGSGVEWDGMEGGNPGDGRGEGKEKDEMGIACIKRCTKRERERERGILSGEDGARMRRILPSMVDPTNAGKVCLVGPSSSVGFVCTNSSVYSCSLLH
ncbi:hypothetical protein BJ684DRAFT_15130 [Piptocephalis cylindrospora]|uniref:Uncharacterized protein n=1 Tax=Piptocephalis cylindrospora TaxID=1907219 RepID=A0A4P9Y6C3_9FUNG|nr:hypothetical protein BJ684DRAFT_15130 [Piptocephalis cylindrospora]|eukprot:RKP14545.1 hypothetical protein BJ684DRAFT_15130 [Piptocephalis cylindrospora]